ncbi:MAG: UDP-N-acetylmuramate--L-alanine ligase [Candidatus Zambryskibacteria bacterium RIFCSPHIGHO2_01_FULL_49_18]|uniref:UDP-N-acetylmuramate--L-alanine ligase n=2 Tax=Parcubacteria group TaxID=1794811 RepID=A0A1G2T3C8_9BACT|nr:MAG: UDP-N-acetylmuramate--L-alanine ligase [Candidatus Yanofskybacteria bacterium RIFCSPLOWO2_01_FULL_49_17]OHA91764.1 MAG: UDP-N-acetylmuramate--L-alanine ligase [Candidatus Zambryskibacteria bacterium RIFCSPHIGHO2_01_FULL_49_18]
MLSRDIRKIYLIGIKGTGMSSLAVLLKKMGYKVTGSDTAEKFFTESQLVKNKIPYFEGFSRKNLERVKPELTIASTAYQEDHEEITAIRQLGIKIISYPQAVGEISKTLESVAICGSHGKTTTTSMLGWIMQTNSQSVTLTGTVADQLNKEFRPPKFFIFEADEYQNKLQYYSPANVILTSVDYDHPDFFKTPAAYAKVFKDFTSRILKNNGSVLFNSGDTLARKMLAGQKCAQSYGFRKSSDYLITGVSPELNAFLINHRGKTILKTKLGVYGRHNILNAAAAGVMAMRLGIKRSMIEKSLATFTGVRRRLESIPSKNFIAVDDYGHHPTEVKAALVALRNKYPTKNIVAVFHPHTLSRTKALLKEFGASFDHADLTIILDIFIPNREKNTNIKIHAKDLVKEIQRNKAKAIYQPNINDAADYVKQGVKKGSVIMTIGAGDIWKMHELIR